MPFDELQEKIRAMKNPSVAGLDARLEYVPEHIRAEKLKEFGQTRRAAAEAIYTFNCGLMDALADIVPAVKPQAAYYENLGWEGMEVLERTIRYAKEKGFFVIADIKRGDIGSTATAYEPYAGTTKSISFGQTVNGGTLDVTTGVLTVTHRYVTFLSLKTGNTDWTYDSTNNAWTFNVNCVSAGSVGEQINAWCPIYKVKPYGYNGTYPNDDYILWAHTYGSLRVKDSRYGSNDTDAFRTMIHDVYVCLPLAAADQTSIQLTPEQVSTLQGTNNIWADTGDVIEVTFGEDIKAYVDAEAADKQDKITVSGILKGDGAGGISATVAGTDYQAPLTAGTDYATPASVPAASAAAPQMDGTAAAGSSAAFARADHVHPTDTGRQAVITASGVLQGDGQGNVTAKSVDTAPASGSSNLITSGAVYAAILGAIGGNY